MTANPVPALRTVTVARSKFQWRIGYFESLVGVKVRMPFMDGDKAMAGWLIAAEETADEITLTFSEVGPE